MKLPRYDFDPTQVNSDLAEAIEYIRLILNYGKYQLNKVTTEPNWEGEDGEMALYDAGGTKWLYVYVKGSGWFKTELTAV